MEAGGTLPALDSTIPLLRPGTFRLDMAAYYAAKPIFAGASPGAHSASAILESLTLGYGLAPRFTIYAGASEANVDHREKGYQADLVDPKVGFVYRAANAAAFWGNTLDVIGDLIVNTPLKTRGGFLAPYGAISPIVRTRLLATRELGAGFTLQVIGGVVASVVTTSLSPGLANSTTFAAASLGLGGQYRLPFLSGRAYVNGELDWLRPITDVSGVKLFASPLRIAPAYSVMLGATYVLKPGFALVRLTDTVSLDEAAGSNPIPCLAPHRFVADTVGVTLSFLNFTPDAWLTAATQ